MKKLLAIMLCIALVCGAAFAVPTTKAEAEGELQTNMGNILDPVLDVLSKNVVANAVQHNVWADAYIGKVFPSVIPHLGVGATASVMLTPFPSSLESIDGISALKDVGLPIPGAAGNGRIGGIMLPFDVGFSYMSLPKTEIIGGMTAEYQTLGFDVRYALIEQSIIMPNVSVGLGYTQSKGAIGMVQTYEGNDVNAALSFKADIYTVSSQVSKDVLFLTPFAGARCSFANDNYAWNADADVTINSNSEHLSAANAKSSGLTENIDFQIYAGLGLRFLVLDTTIGATYDLTTNAYGGNLSFRVSL